MKKLLVDLKAHVKFAETVSIDKTLFAISQHSKRKVNSMKILYKSVPSVSI